MAGEDYKTTIKIEADTANAEQGVKREAAALESLSKSIDTIKNAAAAAWQSIAKLFESIGERLTSLVSQVKELHSTVANSPIADAANKAAAATENLAAKAKDAKSTLQDLTPIANQINVEDGAKRGKGAFESLIGTLTQVRHAVTAVMRAFGLFYLAFNGIKTAYENVKKLVELWKEYKTAVERATLASNITRAVHETNRLSEAQKNLNNQLKEQLTLAQRAAALRSMGQSGAKAFTDEQRNVTRAIELAGATDPRQRQALQDRYAREDEARQRTDTRQTLTGRIGQLSAEAQAYTASAAQARELRNQTSGQIEKELAIQTQQKALNASDEEREATRKRIEALEATRAAALKEQKTFEEEAAYRNQQVQILQMQLKAFEQLGTSAEKVQQEAWRKIEEADAAASKQLADKLATNEAADKWERDFAKATPTEKINMLQNKESSARNRLDTLQSALDEEMGKSVAERNQERMADLRSGIESAQNEMFAARRQREGIQEETVGARQSVSLGSGSRLNAMGLGAGSGVQRVQQEMANSLKDLVRLGRDQLAALKDIGSEDGGATFQ